jgi:hypothetical protein
MSKEQLVEMVKEISPTVLLRCTLKTSSSSKPTAAASKSSGREKATR